MEKLVILLGLNGAGKGEVGKLAIEGTEFQYIDYGDFMAQPCIDAGLIKSRDEIRAKLTQDQWRYYQSIVPSRITNLDGKVLLATHASLASEFGYYPGLPKNILDELKPGPKAIVLLEATQPEIETRRESDPTRRRAYDFERDIDLHQEVNRQYAIGYSVLTGARVKIINNGDSKQDEAAQELRDLLIGI